MSAPAGPLPAPPREVPWRSALGHGWPIASLGIALVLAGTLWAIGAGTSWPSILADPGPEAANAAAARPIGLLVLPGLALLLAWLRGVARLRLLLAQGQMVPAELLFQQHQELALGWVRLGYRYRDQARVVHDARQWVRRRSPEGRAAFAGGRGLWAAIDPLRPERARLVVPEGTLAPPP